LTSLHGPKICLSRRTQQFMIWSTIHMWRSLLETLMPTDQTLPLGWACWSNKRHSLLKSGQAIIPHGKWCAQRCPNNSQSSIRGSS